MTIDIKTYECFFFETESKRAVRGSRFELPHYRHFIPCTTRLVVLSEDEVLRMVVPTGLRNIAGGREIEKDRFFQEEINEARLFIPGKRLGERLRLYWKP